MKRTLSTFFFIAIFSCLSLSKVVAQTVNPQLYFDPKEITVNENSEVELILKINTGKISSSGADAVLDYDSSAFEIVSIENGGFFPLFGKHYEIANKKIYLTGFFAQKTDKKTGEGTFAKLTLKALKSGKRQVNFVCQEKSLVDTNILDEKGVDVLACRDLTGVIIQVQTKTLTVAKSAFGNVLGTSSGILITVTPTEIPTPTTFYATESAVPVTGVFDNTIFLLIFGSALVVFGFIMIGVTQAQKEYVQAVEHFDEIKLN